MQKEYVEKWIENMRQAWLTKDLKAVEVMFAKTTLYYETPFEKPATNIEDIMKLWEGVKEQQIKRLDFDLLALDNNVAIVQWIFEKQEAYFDGIYLIKFNDNGDCLFFKSWEMQK